jgi:hypothetical protein
MKKLFIILVVILSLAGAGVLAYCLYYVVPYTDNELSPTPEDRVCEKWFSDRLKEGSIKIGMTPMELLKVADKDNSPEGKLAKGWLEQRIKEACSIKSGMSRADLLKFFYEDGGVQMPNNVRYLLKKCCLGVTVEFYDWKNLALHRAGPSDTWSRAKNEAIKIKTISDPYVSYSSSN